ncbi:MAG TPA: hypothetical protein HA340_04230 [Candidatus Thalassarchaeaceae archaeon]|nr:MAG TPA: hypothetical protein D7H97_04190 [Candidatus Poseidoniales archaeon]HIH83137.1 hypothetical protein [Candidatus Thalassarchaeaceae archaeon]|tara:strand:+ start:312 stop:995 length:684 start_codon:yes stop_codon:yes gene_type:complete
MALEGITSSTATIGNLAVTARGPYDTDESAKIDASTLPVEVRDLWETMLRLNPNWRIEDWMANRAKEELKIIDANLAKERMRLEQRLGRINALSELMRKKGIEVDEIKWNDPHQRNLFDIFSSEAEAVDEDASDEEVPVEEAHPATMLLDYLPNDGGDDPLMAIVAQLILLKFDEAAAEDKLPLNLEEIGDELEGRGVNPDEVIEALEWLLEKKEIIEIDEDQFTLN